jgi:hypothetical protein
VIEIRRNVVHVVYVYAEGDYVLLSITEYQVNIFFKLIQ